MSNTNLTPAAGSVTGSGNAPSILTAFQLTPTAGAIALTGQLSDTAPWIFLGRNEVSASSNPVTLNYPSNILPGDVLVAVAMSIVTSVSISSPSGAHAFTSRFAYTTSAPYLWLWTKVYDGSESSIDFSNPAGASGGFAILAYRNIEAVPVDAVAAVKHTASVTSLTTNTIVTNREHDSVLSVWSSTGGTREFSSVSPELILRSLVSTGVGVGGRLVVADEDKITAGTTTARTCTWTGTTTVTDTAMGLFLARLPGFSQVALAGYAPSLSIDTAPPLVGVVTLTGGAALTVTTTTPLSGAVSISGAAPVTDTGIRIPTATLAVSGLTPLLQSTFQPPTGSVSLSSQAPVLGFTATPNPASVGLSGSTPIQDTGVMSTVGVLSLTGNTPAESVGLLIRPSAGSASLNSIVTVLSFGTVIDTSAGDIGITTSPPALFYGYKLTTGSGTVSLAGSTPEVTQQVSITVPAGTLLTSGKAAVSQFGSVLAATPGVVSLTGSSPQMVTNSILSPASSSVTVSGLQAGLFKSVTITALSGSVILTSSSPAEDELVQLTTGSISVVGKSAQTSLGTTIVPASGGVTVTPIAGTYGIGCVPQSAIMAMEGSQPIIVKTESQQPGAAMLSIESDPPLVISYSPQITPNSGSIVTTEYPPLFGYVPLPVYIVLGTRPSGIGCRRDS